MAALINEKLRINTSQSDGISVYQVRSIEVAAQCSGSDNV